MRVGFAVTARGMSFRMTTVHEYELSAGDEVVGWPPQTNQEEEGRNENWDKHAHGKASSDGSSMNFLPAGRDTALVAAAELMENLKVTEMKTDRATIVDDLARSKGGMNVLREMKNAKVTAEELRENSVLDAVVVDRTHVILFETT